MVSSRARPHTLHSRFAPWLRYADAPLAGRCDCDQHLSHEARRQVLRINSAEQSGASTPTGQKPRLFNNNRSLVLAARRRE